MQVPPGMPACRCFADEPRGLRGRPQGGQNRGDARALSADLPVRLLVLHRPPGQVLASQEAIESRHTRETRARDSGAAHQSGDACGSAIGRTTLDSVPSHAASSSGAAFKAVPNGAFPLVGLESATLVRAHGGGFKRPSVGIVPLEPEHSRPTSPPAPRRHSRVASTSLSFASIPSGPAQRRR